MQSAALHEHEDRRIAALRRYDLLDTESETALDEIVEMASTVCGTAVALVSLVDSDRQWFKAKVGIDAVETPREVAFCAHAILEPESVFEVPDATRDARFHDNPLVVGGPRVQFYAGATIQSSDGFPLGTLCVIDSKPAQLSAEQRRTLQLLAHRVEAHFEHRHLLKELAESSRRALRLEGVLRTYSGKEVWDTVGQTLSGNTPTILDDDDDRTFVFADLNGFTELSELLGPSEVAEVLNARLGEAVDIALAYHGDVEKFIGDCIFTVFDDVFDALAFARALHQSSARCKPVRGQKLTFSVGVHSGPAQRVHIGNASRRDNTLIGEGVNVAARLQSACPPNETMVSNATLRLAAPQAVRKTMELQLKGVTAPVKVHLLDNGPKARESSVIVLDMDSR